MVRLISFIYFTMLKFILLCGIMKVTRLDFAFKFFVVGEHFYDGERMV